MAQLSLKFRIHEWFAERVKWVQYPGVSTDGPLFRTAMPWSTRILLVLFGVILLVLCAIALFFLGLLAWAVITA
jgi:hypothetical protein